MSEDTHNIFFGFIRRVDSGAVVRCEKGDSDFIELNNPLFRIFSSWVCDGRRACGPCPCVGVWVWAGRIPAPRRARRGWGPCRRLFPGSALSGGTWAGRLG